MALGAFVLCNQQLRDLRLRPGLGLAEIELGLQRVACRRRYHTHICRIATDSRRGPMAGERPVQTLPAPMKQALDPSERELTSRELAVLRMLAEGEVTR